MRTPVTPAWWHVVLCACVLLVGCGSVGEPLYPALNVPLRVTDLTAVERGDKIDIHFTIAPKTTEGLVLQQIGSIELRIGASPAAGFQAAEWAAGAERVNVPPPAQPGAIHTQRAVQDFIGKQVLVGVRVGNAKGRMSEWSNFFPITVEPPLAKVINLKAEPVPEGVRLTWSAPNQTAFRIFRKAGEQKDPSLLATSDKPEYVDASTEYGTTYQYYVQGIHEKTESELVESNIFTPRDIFPPQIPVGLAASAGIGAIELAWTRNTEPDFKEYRVFRSEENGPYIQIAGGLEAPAYSDRKIESGKHYRYRLTAVDQTGNQSGQSEPVEITTP